MTGAAGNPPTTLPWWMATAMVLAWVAAVAGVFVIARYRRRLARDRRPRVLPAAPEPEPALPERAGGRRQLGPGP